MSLLDLITRITYKDKSYDDLTDEQKKFADDFFDEIRKYYAQIFATRPYKANLNFDWNYQPADNIRLQAPPSNYREEHEQFIARLLYIQLEKDKRIDFTSMYPKLRKVK